MALRDRDDVPDPREASEAWAVWGLALLAVMSGVLILVVWPPRLWW